MTKRVLGRGLEALLSANAADAGVADSTRSINEVKVSLIIPNDAQPRRRFDPDRIAELAESIRAKGILQPIVVRKKGDHFQIVAGERRFLAAKQAGLKDVPVVVHDVPDDEMLQWALIENLQRADLDAVEEAEAFRLLIEEKGVTHEALSSLVGRDRTSITNSIRLLHLSEPMLRAMAEGRITPGHGRALLQVPEGTPRNRLFSKVLKGGLSVRRTEELARGVRPARKRVAGSGSRKDPQLESLEERLRLRFGTRIHIRPIGEGGVVEIEFYSPEEFDRIFAELLAGEEGDDSAREVL